MLFSEMSKAQLQEEMARIQEMGRQAVERDQWSEAAILRTRWYLAASYLMEPRSIETERWYYIEGDQNNKLYVTHLDGIMAHGRLRAIDSQVEALQETDPFDAFPTAMLSLSDSIAKNPDL